VNCESTQFSLPHPLNLLVFVRGIFC
jgi:hypothetical protein